MSGTIPGVLVSPDPEEEEKKVPLVVLFIRRSNLGHSPPRREDFF